MCVLYIHIFLLNLICIGVNNKRLVLVLVLVLALVRVLVLVPRVAKRKYCSYGKNTSGYLNKFC